MSASPDQPWSETAPPALVIDTIQFTGADTASVSASDLQLSPLPRRIVVTFVMKREGPNWKIASLRVVGSSFPAIDPGAAAVNVVSQTDRLIDGVPAPQPVR